MEFPFPQSEEKQPDKRQFQNSVEESHQGHGQHQRWGCVAWSGTAPD